MRNAHVSKESSALWTFVCLFLFFYLGIDVFFSFYNGETLKMRGSGYLYFNEFPIFFIFTVFVKLLVLLYCCFYLYKRLIYYKSYLNQLIKKKNKGIKKDALLTVKNRKKKQAAYKRRN
jgi:hypothetical protein